MLKTGRIFFMKRLVFLLVLTFLTKLSLSQTDSIVFRPDSISGKDAMVWSINPNTNYGDKAQGTITAWTYLGTYSVKRLYLQFCLDGINPNLVIDSAIICLFNNPTSPSHNGEHYGENQFVIQSVTSAWDEHLITFNNQPTTTSNNQILVPKTNYEFQNFRIRIDDLTRDLIRGENYGFYLKIENEQTYRSVVLATSDHIDKSRHPKLVIFYNEAKNTRQELNQCILVNGEMTEGARMICDSLSGIPLNTTINNAIYLWSTGSTNQSITVYRTGEYWVRVESEHCYWTDTIVLSPCVQSNIIMPNVITPNNDGVNDVFEPIERTNVDLMHTIIFNRWGSKVFESNNPSILWDGSGCADGVYFWTIEYHNHLSELEQLHGTVTLSR
jgi:gliding motility-associated-like protein